jgi:hypothetical protein
VLVVVRRANVCAFGAITKDAPRSGEVRLLLPLRAAEAANFCASFLNGFRHTVSGAASIADEATPLPWYDLEDAVSLGWLRSEVLDGRWTAECALRRCAAPQTRAHLSDLAASRNGMRPSVDPVTIEQISR